MKNENNYTLRSYTRENGVKVYSLEKNGVPIKQSNSLFDLQLHFYDILSDKNNNITLEANPPKKDLQVEAYNENFNPKNKK